MGRALVLTSILATACGSSPARPPERPTLDNAAAPAADACLADRVPATVPPAGTPIECAGVESDCRAACAEGNAAICLSLAYTLEPDEASNAESVQLYGRACELGDLNGCTNYGAYLLDGLGGLTADPPCAARLHERACQGDEPYGCGMFGRELALGVGAARDVVRARELLEASCDKLGSYACHALGLLREGGHLGAVDRVGAVAAFRRACDTGNPPSCGDAERVAAEQP